MRGQGGASLANWTKDAQTAQERPRALLPGQRIRWMKAHLKLVDVDSGRVDDFQGNQQADLLANQGRAQPRGPEPTYRPKTQSPFPAAPARVPATDAPFQLAKHKRVVKHADFLQCLD
eukprot:3128187-Amphidinium_carterae.1